jgi:hypothetical protein
VPYEEEDTCVATKDSAPPGFAASSSCMHTTFITFVCVCVCLCVCVCVSE